MLDKLIQPYTQPFLKVIGKILIRFFTPNQISFAGFFIGILMCIFIILNLYPYALLALFFNRLFDGLDGAMARLRAPSFFGGYIDIIFDFLIYSGFVLSFGLSNNSNLIFSCILLFLYIGTSSTFLGYAAVIKNNDSLFKTDNSREINKTFYYASGLVEGFETIIFMIICLLAPNFFNVFAFLFSILCIITIIGRILLSYKEFKK